MTDLQKQFEATGYASWINSELYPDGQIYTKEYTQWLEKQLQAKQQSKPEIIAEIAAYLEKETNVKYGFLKQPERVEFGGSLNPAHFTHAGFCQEIAAEIYTAIAPMVEAGEPNWKDVVKIQDESTYTFNLVISGVVVGYASKAGLQSKYTFHPAQHLALSAAHLNAIAAAIKHYN